jgi:C4-dicarboxylate transporter DctQ subunit
MRALHWLERHFEEAICCIGLSVVATCVFLQVIMRYGFNTALQWTEEVAAIGMVWAVYMGASLCVRERFHIRIMAGVMLLPRMAAKAVIVISDVLWAAFSIFMLWVGVDYLDVLWRFTSRTPSLGIDEFWPQSIVVIGYALMLLRLAQIYVIWVRGGGRGMPGMRPEHDYDVEPGASG